MGKISIVGLGPGDYSLISQGALEALQNGKRIFLRTEKHPIVDKLRESIQFTSLDYFYDREDNFENVYNKIALTIEETKSFDIEELKSGIYVSDEEFEQTFMYKDPVLVCERTSDISFHSLFNFHAQVSTCNKLRTLFSALYHVDMLLGDLIRS